MSTLLSILAPLCLLQSVEYRSPAGVEYRSQRDTGAIARAESALAADPRNVDKIIALGVAQSGVRQYREAIATFTRGIGVAPNNALLYRWRGHRYLSTRQFDKAMGDLQRVAGLGGAGRLDGLVVDVAVTRGSQSRGPGDARSPPRCAERGQRVRTAAAPLSRRDSSRFGVHARRHQRYPGGDAELRHRQLVSGAG